MNFQPVIPSGGNLGWAFLSRTRDSQQAAFENSPSITRLTDYFRENVLTITSAEDLVRDRRLLTVALGAFGLDDDIDNRFFVKTVLEEGTLNDDAFANRLADKRYFALAKAFAFDLSPPNTQLSDFPDRLISQFRERQFEIAVGNQDENLRLALGLERDLNDLAERELSEPAAWYTIMGTPPLREVFETAFGLPAQTGALDVDKQLEIFREKSLKYFGTSNPSDFSENGLRENLVRRFLLGADLADTNRTTTRGAVALSLLSALPTPQ